MRPIRIPWRVQIRKIGSQSKNGWLMPKIEKKLSPRMWKTCGKPNANMRSNLDVPPASRFINMPKKINVGIKPYQKRRSLVASKIPLPAIKKSSNHFLQFI